MSSKSDSGLNSLSDTYNDEDIIVIDAEGELTSPEDDLPNISLKRAPIRSATKTNRPPVNWNGLASNEQVTHKQTGKSQVQSSGSSVGTKAAVDTKSISPRRVRPETLYHDLSHACRRQTFKGTKARPGMPSSELASSTSVLSSSKCHSGRPSQSHNEPMKSHTVRVGHVDNHRAVISPVVAQQKSKQAPLPKTGQVRTSESSASISSMDEKGGHRHLLQSSKKQAAMGSQSRPSLSGKSGQLGVSSGKGKTPRSNREKDNSPYFAGSLQLISAMSGEKHGPDLNAHKPTTGEHAHTPKSRPMPKKDRDLSRIAPNKTVNTSFSSPVTAIVTSEAEASTSHPPSSLFAASKYPHSGPSKRPPPVKSGCPMSTPSVKSKHQHSTPLVKSKHPLPVKSKHPLSPPPLKSKHLLSPPVKSKHPLSPPPVKSKHPLSPPPIRPNHPLSPPPVTSKHPPARPKHPLSPPPVRPKHPLSPPPVTSKHPPARPKHPLSPPPVKSKHPLSPSPTRPKHPPPVKSKHPLSPPPVSSKHPLSPPAVSSSLMKKSHKEAHSNPNPLSPTLKHSQNHLKTNPSKNPKKSVSSYEERETETECSSMFDFNDTDLFEVLDSVESESICSAYNQSDTESMGTPSEGYSSKPTSEPDQPHPSKLVRSLKSPSESRIQDFTKSFVKKKRRVRQVARKSTTFKGAKCYKNPLKGKGLLQLKRYCTLRLTCVQYAKVRREIEKKQSEIESLSNVPAECPAKVATPPLPTKMLASESSLGKKKRESKSQEASTSSKRPKLQCDSPASKAMPVDKVPSINSLSKKQRMPNTQNRPAAVATYVDNLETSDTHDTLSSAPLQPVPVVQSSKPPKSQPEMKQRDTVSVVKPKGVSLAAGGSKCLPSQDCQLPEDVLSQKDKVHMPALNPAPLPKDQRLPLPLILRRRQRVTDHPPGTVSTSPANPASNTSTETPTPCSNQSGRADAQSEQSHSSQKPASSTCTPKKCLSLKQLRLNQEHSDSHPSLPLHNQPSSSTAMREKGKTDEKSAAVPGTASQVDPQAKAPPFYDNHNLDHGPEPHAVDIPGPEPHGVDTPGPEPHGADASGPAPHGADRPGPEPHGAEAPGPEPHGVDALGPAPHGADRPGPEPHGVEAPGPAPHGVDASGPAPHGVDRPGPEPHGAEAPGPAPHGADASGPAPHGADQPGPEPHGAEAPGPAPHGVDIPGPEPHGAEAPGPEPHGAEAPDPAPHGVDIPGPEPHGAEAPGPEPHGAEAPGPAPHGMDIPGPEPHGAEAPGPAPHGVDTPGPEPHGAEAPGPAPRGVDTPGPAPHGVDTPGPELRRADTPGVSNVIVPTSKEHCVDTQTPAEDMTMSVQSTTETTPTSETSLPSVECESLACRERSFSTTSEDDTRLSERDEAYDLRLLETIAKLAPEPAEDTATTTHNRPSSIMSVERPQADGRSESRELSSLTVKIPLSKLSRIPAVSSVVTTRGVGMFRDKAVQAERGMFVDKDVLDAYLVVKLHEAMFSMKAELQVMETQVANISKQKESLEKTLQAKTNYIREMTTTGFKPRMVDVGTDPILCSPPRFKSAKLATVATQTKKLSSPPRRHSKGVKTVEKGIQTATRVYNSASQTEGVVRTVPARLRSPSHIMCLYKHPDSELQLYIEEGKQSVACSTDNQSDSKEENPTLNHDWLSASVEGECARSVPVSPRVRFARAIQTLSTCGTNRLVSAGSLQQTDAQTLSDSTETAAKPGEPESTGRGNTTCRQNREECLPLPIRTSISKLIEVYYRLNALPKEPVQEVHMVSLLKAIHHLLSHLPVSIEAPGVVTPSTPTPCSDTATGVPSTSSPISTHPPSEPLPATPPCTECPSSSSPPTTPGTASWSMGAKLQELVEVLGELEEKGKDVFPRYFKAELALLQTMVHHTLTFLTTGLQHETFTHDRLGCIVDSDLQMRPWRDRDLQMNPFFRRLCLDVGIRGLMQEVKRLMQQNRQGKRLGQSLSDDDSDLDDVLESPSPKRVVKAQSSRAGKPRTGKVVRMSARKFKSPISKSEQIRIARTKSARVSSASSDRGASFAPLRSTPSSKSTYFVNTLSPATSRVASTNSPPLASPPQHSTFSKRVGKGDSFQARVADIQSSVKTRQVSKIFSPSIRPELSPVHSELSSETSSAPPPVPAVQAMTLEHKTRAVTSTVGSKNRSKLTFQSIASIPSNIEALGGDVNAQRLLAERILGLAPETTLTSVPSSVSGQSKQSSAPIIITSPTKTTPTTTIAQSETRSSMPKATFTKTTPTASVAQSEGKGPHHFREVVSQGMTQRTILESLVRLMQNVQLAPSVKGALQKMIQNAFHLTLSMHPTDLQMAQLLINQIKFHLHQAAVKAMPSWNGGMSVFIQPMVSPPPVPHPRPTSSAPHPGSSLRGILPLPVVAGSLSNIIKSQSPMAGPPLVSGPFAAVAPLQLTSSAAHLRASHIANSPSVHTFSASYSVDQKVSTSSVTAGLSSVTHTSYTTSSISNPTVVKSQASHVPCSTAQSRVSQANELVVIQPDSVVPELPTTSGKQGQEVGTTISSNEGSVPLSTTSETTNSAKEGKEMITSTEGSVPLLTTSESTTSAKQGLKGTTTITSAGRPVPLSTTSETTNSTKEGKEMTTSTEGSVPLLTTSETTSAKQGLKGTTTITSAGRPVPLSTTSETTNSTKEGKEMTTSTEGSVPLLTTSETTSAKQGLKGTTTITSAGRPFPLSTTSETTNAPVTTKHPANTDTSKTKGDNRGATINTPVPVPTTQHCAEVLKSTIDDYLATETHANTTKACASSVPGAPLIFPIINVSETLPIPTTSTSVTVSPTAPVDSTAPAVVSSTSASWPLKWRFDHLLKHVQKVTALSQGGHKDNEGVSPVTSSKQCSVSTSAPSPPNTVSSSDNIHSTSNSVSKIISAVSQANSTVATLLANTASSFTFSSVFKTSATRRSSPIGTPKFSTLYGHFTVSKSTAGVTVSTTSIAGTGPTKSCSVATISSPVSSVGTSSQSVPSAINDVHNTCTAPCSTASSGYTSSLTTSTTANSSTIDTSAPAAPASTVTGATSASVSSVTTAQSSSLYTQGSGMCAPSNTTFSSTSGVVNDTMNSTALCMTPSATAKPLSATSVAHCTTGMATCNTVSGLPVVATTNVVSGPAIAHSSSGTITSNTVSCSSTASSSLSGRTVGQCPTVSGTTNSLSKATVVVAHGSTGVVHYATANTAHTLTVPGVIPHPTVAGRKSTACQTTATGVPVVSSVTTPSSYTAYCSTAHEPTSNASVTSTVSTSKLPTVQHSSAFAQSTHHSVTAHSAASTDNITALQYSSIHTTAHQVSNSSAKYSTAHIAPTAAHSHSAAPAPTAHHPNLHTVRATAALTNGTTHTSDNHSNSTSVLVGMRTRVTPALPGRPPSYPVPQLVRPVHLSHIPPQPVNITLRGILEHGPPPAVKVQANKVPNGLLIKWTFAPEHLRYQTSVVRYDLYAFVCNKGTKVPDVSQWGKVGEIRPLALPMAVTLTNFAIGQCYAFSVRVNYIGGLTSCYSEPCTIDL